MHFEIAKNKLGNPYLKKSDRPHKRSVDGRGQWVQIGKLTDHGIERSIRVNQEQGLLVLLDEEGFYRTLVLTE